MQHLFIPHNYQAITIQMPLSAVVPGYGLPPRSYYIPPICNGYTKPSAPELRHRHFCSSAVKLLNIIQEKKYPGLSGSIWPVMTGFGPMREESLELKPKTKNIELLTCNTNEVSFYCCTQLWTMDSMYGLNKAILIHQKNLVFPAFFLPLHFHLL
jgi:hypothetical protein